MILLITGASHTGKTQLAQKLLEKYHYPYLSIDHLKMGLIRSGNTDLTPMSDEGKLTAYLWPIVREMIKTAIENQQNLTVEGCYIPFDWEKDFEQSYREHIQYKCLILSENYIRRHFGEIKKYANCIENRLDDSFCTMESVLRDNAENLALAQKNHVDYLLIDEQYDVTPAVFPIKTATKENLAAIAYKAALLPYHGKVNGKESNLEPLIRPFPHWNVKDADNGWCAAFVYYCLCEAGFSIPYSPDECVSCSLAGCGGFEEFALGDKRIGYYRPGDGFCPSAGDLVLFDRVFSGQEHDHIGIVICREENTLLVAEGNIPGTNTSGLVKRNMDEHIRCYLRFPDGYRYRARKNGL